MVNRTADRRGAAASAPRFEYKYRDERSVRERAERKGGGRFDSPFVASADVWRSKSGENQVRIMPPTWEGHDHYALLIWTHPWVGSENGEYLCLRKMQGNFCPICALAKAAQDGGDEEEFQQLKVKEKYCCWVIDRDSQAQTPQVFLMGWQLDRDIAALTFNSRTSPRVIPIDHPDEGYDIVIRRTGEKLNTRYLPSIVPAPCPIFDDPARQAEVLQYIEEHPMPSMLKYFDAGYLSRVMSGTQEETDPLDRAIEETSQDYDHEAEEAAAASSRRAAPPTRAPAPRTQARAAPAPDQEEAAGPTTRPAPRSAPQTRASPAPARSPAPAPRPASAPAAGRARPPVEEVEEEYAPADEAVADETVSETTPLEDEGAPLEEAPWEGGGEEVEEAPLPAPRSRPQAATRPATTPATATRPAAAPAARPAAAARSPAPAGTRPAAPVPGTSAPRGAATSGASSGRRAAQQPVTQRPVPTTRTGERTTETRRVGSGRPQYEDD